MLPAVGGWAGHCWKVAGETGVQGHERSWCPGTAKGQR